ncbi:MAG TPA: type 1 glutamine amidotransferase [Actinomycetota bacterium]
MSRAKPIVLVRNDDVDTLGIAPRALEEAGADRWVWEARDGQPPPDLDEVGGMIVFGSTYNVEHADEQPFIDTVAASTRQAIERGVPYLGVCFGAQLLAWALGAEVKRSPVRELGFEPVRALPPATEDRLLSHYVTGDHVFQWHMDTFELPNGSELLLTGDSVPHQGYRVGERAWGVQFHLEVDAAEIATWLEAYARVGDLLQEWGKTPDEVTEEARVLAAAHERRGAEVFRHFVALAGDVAA